jgi:hypothetical protein
MFNSFFAESTTEVLPGMIAVKKVVNGLEGTSSIIPSNVLLIGRYGEWSKSVMAHNVYEKVKSIINDRKV